MQRIDAFRRARRARLSGTRIGIRTREMIWL